MNEGICTRDGTNMSSDPHLLKNLFLILRNIRIKSSLQY